MLILHVSCSEHTPVEGVSNSRLSGRFAIVFLWLPKGLGKTLHYTVQAFCHRLALGKSDHVTEILWEILRMREQIVPGRFPLALFPGCFFFVGEEQQPVQSVHASPEK